MVNDYNRIVLIGNGFDKALGLKTSYADFILNYLQEVAIEAFRNKSHSTKLMSIKLLNPNLTQSVDTYIDYIKRKYTVKDLLNFIKGVTNISYKYDFFKDIVDQYVDARWVDIEQNYFNTLKHHFTKFKAQNLYTKNLEDIIALNNCMDELTVELNKFIVKQQNNISLSFMKSHFSSLTDKIFEPLRPDHSELVKRHNRQKVPVRVIFLNFNYTNTVKQILNKGAKSINLHIHGTVNDENNPIIFGYGDDTGEEYKQFEVEGENEFLRKIKSFHYPRTNNYHKLLNYLEEREFDVFVVGHSCGLSDKTLLKTIFEHEKCLAIQNFHYKGKPEDFNKRMEISRHFSNKILMRERVLPFDAFALIPQLPENK